MTQSQIDGRTRLKGIIIPAVNKTTRTKMRYTIIALFLATLASNATAGWTEIGKTAKSTVYIDIENIRRSGSIVKIWTMRDFFTPVPIGGETMLSSSAFDEIDCEERKSRTLQSTPFKGPMGDGGIIFLNPAVPEWSYVQPGSSFERVLEIACAKK